MIRVLLVDDHPTVRAGLHALLRGEPGLVPVGWAEDAEGAVARCADLRADVVLLDVHMPAGSGLLVARRLKALATPPRVVLFSAFADETLLVPALLAGVDGMLGKEAGGGALFDVIRRVYKIGCVLPRPPVEQVRAAMARLAVEDQTLAAMALAGTPVPDAARVLGIDAGEAEHRVDRMLARLERARA